MDSLAVAMRSRSRRTHGALGIVVIFSWQGEREGTRRQHGTPTLQMLLKLALSVTTIAPGPMAALGPPLSWPRLLDVMTIVTPPPP